MSNPWLGLPLGDYEGHMQSPGVGQLAVLSDLFREVLTMRSPQSVAILGIAGKWPRAPGNRRYKTCHWARSEP
jgi:hypothetical protein